jgi:heme/copper-type cytochrome/quinol oxidase subunit 3
LHDVAGMCANACALLLLCICETALFGCAFWVVCLILLLCCASTNTTMATRHCSINGMSTLDGWVFQNSMTAVSSNLLFATGLICLLVLQFWAPCLSKQSVYLMLLIILGAAFVGCLCCEYINIYTVLAGSVMLFYVITGLHGSHVVIGLGCLVGLHLARCSEAIISLPTDNSHLGGSLGIMLYWHFVDAV